MLIDTRRQIREELQALELLGESTQRVRTGINATGIYIETAEAKVVLFFTGRHHASEIVDRLLEHRPRALQSPRPQARRDHRRGLEELLSWPRR